MLPVLSLSFANDAANPLANLLREHQEVERLFLSRNNQDFLAQFDGFATIDGLVEKLRASEGEICLFHFSGHAWRDRLMLADQAVFVDGLALQFKKQTALGFVFLNGCASAGQVQALLDMGVPAVLATSDAIPDDQAADFSIEFYRQLAIPYTTIDEAFEAAKAYVALKYQGASPVKRGISSLQPVQKPEEQTANFLWGLYVKEGDERSKSWQLPLREVVVEEIPKPNEHLVNSLFRAWSKDSELIVRLIEEKKRDNKPIIFLDKRIALLNSLPSPISEQLRKLLAPVGDESKFGYDQFGLPRLLQMIHTYNTSFELTSFIMLAQLWQEVKMGRVKDFSPGLKEVVQKFFKRTLTPVSGQEIGVDEYDYIRLIREIRLTLDNENVAYFVTQLTELRQTFGENGDFTQACTFFEAQKKRLVSRQPTAAEARQLSIVAEKHLTNFMTPLAFWSVYKLLSINNIDFWKLRHQLKPSYRLFYFPLETGATGAKTDQLSRLFDSPSDCKSVVITKSVERATENLNLSPFVIDENSYRGNASMSKLLFFKSMSSSPAGWNFDYVHVKIPRERIPLTVKKKQEDDDWLEESEAAPADNYGDVKAQWDDFAQTIFGQSLEAITTGA